MPSRYSKSHDENPIDECTSQNSSCVLVGALVDSTGPIEFLEMVTRCDHGAPSNIYKPHGDATT
jgi:hypothetical protein